jgi:putative endonuclease
VLYTGVTNNLHERLRQHCNKINAMSFTAKYNVSFLVHYEKYDWIHNAIEREKEIKNYPRQKKLDLIRKYNPNMEFLNHLFDHDTQK